MKIYTNWAFLRPVNTSLHGDFTIENQVFNVSIKHAGQNYPGSGLKEMSVFEIFYLFMYHCVVKRSMCSVMMDLLIFFISFWDNELMDILFRKKILQLDGFFCIIWGIKFPTHKFGIRLLNSELKNKVNLAFAFYGHKNTYLSVFVYLKWQLKFS